MHSDVIEFRRGHFLEFIELQPRPGFRSPPQLSPTPSPTIEFRIERALTIQVTDGFHATVGGKRKLIYTWLQKSEYKAAGGPEFQLYREPPTH